jgi:PAS domain S-box-containing protein
MNMGQMEERRDETDDRNSRRVFYGEIVTAAIVCLGLYFSVLYNYLLFHSLSEIFSIIIAMAVFMFALNTRRYVDNDYFTFLGIAYFFVGAIDLVHTLAYSGMNIFRGYDADLPTQMWLSARYLESLSLLAAPVFLYRRLHIAATGLALTVVVGLMLAAVFCWKVFPVAFVDGIGLTPFKIVSEYLISMVLLTSAVLLYRQRSRLAQEVYRLMVFSIMITILSEMAFTLYTDPYGPANFIGHFLKVVSFYLVYKSIIRTGLRKPYRTIFYDLQEKKKALADAKSLLEQRVYARTAELAAARDHLQQEVLEKEDLLGKIGESEKRIQFVWDAIPMMNFTLDSAGNVTALNRFAVEQLGYQPEELMNRPVTDIFHEEDRPAVLAQLDAILRYPETIHEWELRKIHKNGQVVWVKEIARLAKDHEGGTVVLIACQDVTESKKAKALLEVAEKKYQDLYDNAPVMYISVDAATTLIRDCNRTLVKKLGYSREEIVGRPIFDMYHPDGMDDARKAFQSFVETGEVNDAELQLRRKDGTKIDVSLNVSAVRDADGKALYSRSCWTDITVRKKTQAIIQTRFNLSEYATTHTEDELLQETLDAAEKLTGSNIGFFHYLDDDQQILNPRTWSTNTLRVMCRTEAEECRYPIDATGVWVECIHQGKPVINNDYPSLSHKKGLPPGHTAVARVLAVPVMREAKIVAIIGVGNKAVDYNDNDIETVSTLSSMVWDIILRQKKESELQKQQRQLEKLVRERTAELAEKNTELTEKNRKLKEMNKLFVDREFRIKALKEKLREVG